MSQKDICNFDVRNTNADGQHNYILQVDLLYPEELHDEHTDYPMAGALLLIQLYKVYLL